MFRARLSSCMLIEKAGNLALFRWKCLNSLFPPTAEVPPRVILPFRKGVCLFDEIVREWDTQKTSAFRGWIRRRAPAPRGGRPETRPRRRTKEGRPPGRRMRAQTRVPFLYFVPRGRGCPSGRIRRSPPLRFCSVSMLFGRRTVSQFPITFVHQEAQRRRCDTRRLLPRAPGYHLST